MAWPPAALPTNRTNASPQQDTHPADHNAIAQAINDTVAVVQQLAPGYAAHAFVGAEQAGIQAAFTTLTGVRCDYVEKVGHKYSFQFAGNLRKGGGDSVGTASVQFVHSSGGVMSTATMSMAVVPYYWPTTIMAVRVGAVAAPVNLIVHAKTDVGWLNVGNMSLLVVVLGPVGP